MVVAWVAGEKSTNMTMTTWKFPRDRFLAALADLAGGMCREIQEATLKPPFDPLPVVGEKLPENVAPYPIRLQRSPEEEASDKAAVERYNQYIEQCKQHPIDSETAMQNAELIIQKAVDASAEKQQENGDAEKPVE